MHTFWSNSGLWGSALVRELSAGEARGLRQLFSFHSAHSEHSNSAISMHHRISLHDQIPQIPQVALGSQRTQPDMLLPSLQPSTFAGAVLLQRQFWGGLSPLRPKQGTEGVPNEQYAIAKSTFFGGAKGGLYRWRTESPAFLLLKVVYFLPVLSQLCSAQFSFWHVSHLVNCEYIKSL